MEAGVADHVWTLEEIATLANQNGDATMPVVPPFHSYKEEQYHNNSKCGLGSEIPARNRQSGTGNKPLCKECAKLNREGK
jgi:hypothetical protein